MALLRERQPELNVSDTVEEAVRDAHVVMVLTQWREFVELDPAQLVHLPAAANVIDGRNVLNPRRWSDAGWRYFGMGRGVSIW